MPNNHTVPVGGSYKNISYDNQRIKNFERLVSSFIYIFHTESMITRQTANNATSENQNIGNFHVSVLVEEWYISKYFPLIFDNIYAIDIKNNCWKSLSLNRLSDPIKWYKFLLALQNSFKVL